jgi:hypothetical protein
MIQMTDLLSLFSLPGELSFEGFVIFLLKSFIRLSHDDLFATLPPESMFMQHISKENQHTF